MFFISSNIIFLFNVVFSFFLWRVSAPWSECWALWRIKLTAHSLQINRVLWDFSVCRRVPGTLRLHYGQEQPLSLSWAPLDNPQCVIWVLLSLPLGSVCHIAVLSLSLPLISLLLSLCISSPPCLFILSAQSLNTTRFTLFSLKFKCLIDQNWSLSLY